MQSLSKFPLKNSVLSLLGRRNIYTPCLRYSSNSDTTVAPSLLDNDATTNIVEEENVIQFKSRPNPRKSIQLKIPPKKPRFLPTTDINSRSSILQRTGEDEGVFPDYCTLFDFESKTDLQGWKIVTDAGMNGTSEAKIAWGKAKNPITGEPMRTLVFYGRLGSLVISNKEYEKETKDSNNVISSFMKKLSNIQKSHSGSSDGAVGADVLDTRASQANRDETEVLREFTEQGYTDVQGFCGLLSPEFSPPLVPQNWDLYNIAVRTDEGPWICSIKPTGLTSNDLFLASLAPNTNEIANPRLVDQVKDKPMRNLFLPITQFTASANGRVRSGFTPSTEHPFEGFGISIRGPPGPFKIEIGWIAMARSTDSQFTEKYFHTGISPRVYANVELSEDAREYLKHSSELGASVFAHKQEKYVSQVFKQEAEEVAEKNADIYDDAVITLNELKQSSKKVNKLAVNLSTQYKTSSVDGLYGSFDDEEAIAILQKEAKLTTGKSRPVIATSIEQSQIIDLALELQHEVRASQKPIELTLKPDGTPAYNIFAQLGGHTTSTTGDKIDPTGGSPSKSNLNPEYLKEFEKKK